MSIRQPAARFKCKILACIDSDGSSVISEIIVVAIGGQSARFVLHWGEMGARWGVNRTMAQIHALLFLSAEPLRADQIAEALSAARSNVSTSLRELHGWGLVRTVHVLGDRRDHFETSKDVWEMFQTILEQRKRREIDPTLECLRALRDSSDGEDEYARARIADMLSFFEDVDAVYADLSRVPRGALKAARVGGRLQTWLRSLGRGG